MCIRDRHLSAVARFSDSYCIFLFHPPHTNQNNPTNPNPTKPHPNHKLIRAKRVSNCWCSKKKICTLCVCSTNLGFSGEKFCACVRLILVLVWYQVRIMYQIRMYLVSAGRICTYVRYVPPVDAHVWRQLHLSAVARCSDIYCIFVLRYASTQEVLEPVLWPLTRFWAMG